MLILAWWGCEKTEVFFPSLYWRTTCPQDTCLVRLIHLIYGGFQAFGLLRVSVTQRMARALSFIVYSGNTLIVLLFLSLYRLCFVVDLKISLFWVFLFYSHTRCFSFNRLTLWSHSTFHQSSLKISKVQSHFLKPFSKCPYQLCFHHVV